MRAYTHILVAVDFSPDAARIVERAVELARLYDARMSMVYVVEYLPMTMDNEFILPPSMEVEDRLMDNARKQLDEMAARMGLTDVVKHVELGSTKLEILRVAGEQGVDLIVVGSHGRHGLARVLGSTANAIMHAAPCDVLAVRVRA